MAGFFLTQVMIKESIDLPAAGGRFYIQKN